MKENRLTLEPTPGRIIDFGGGRREEQPASLEMFRIGQLAEPSGMTPDTLRYYARHRLLPTTPRTSGGLRMYPAATTLVRLRFIKQAQVLGLSLDEIREVLRHLDRGGRSHCGRVRELLVAKLQELDARLMELREFRRPLQGYIQQCNEGLRRHGGEPCPVTAELH
ncbi:MAG: MerR family DNA-binding protein [Luteitalea sp.]|nr:MerR family DNA-binding protein [Luteitalea sp.]